jgi:hypothetical protein
VLRALLLVPIPKARDVVLGNIQHPGYMCLGFTRFLLKRGVGRAKVYRRRNECFANNCIQEVDRFGDGSAMMWAAITHLVTHSPVVVKIEAVVFFGERVCLSRPKDAQLASDREIWTQR